MYEVDIGIGGDREGYWALLRFEDRQGKPHRKEIRQEREADKNSNLLQAAVVAAAVRGDGGAPGGGS